MTYYCQDCSYRGKTASPGGDCPACGSFALTRRSSAAEEEQPPAAWRLYLMWALWAVFIGMVAWKVLD